MIAKQIFQATGGWEYKANNSSGKDLREDLRLPGDCSSSTTGQRNLPLIYHDWEETSLFNISAVHKSQLQSIQMQWTMIEVMDIYDRKLIKIYLLVWNSIKIVCIEGNRTFCILFIIFLIMLYWINYLARPKFRSSRIQIWIYWVLANSLGYIQPILRKIQQ